MFFSFTSEHEYSESDWTRVWEAEVHLQAIVLEYGLYMRRLSNDDMGVFLQKKILDLQRNTAYCAKLVEKQWLSTFLAKEIGQIADFIRRLDPRMLREADVERLGLKPNANLQFAIDQSDAFKQYLLSRKQAEK